MNYLIAVLTDRIKAEAASIALEEGGIPQSQIAIIGKGYKSADEFGLLDPKEQAKKQAKQMAYWLIPFGFGGGYVFDFMTGLDTFAWAGEPLNHVVGGILGAIGGAMGSFFVGGGVGLSFGSGDALPYRNRLDVGKYLIVVEGTQSLHDRATNILRDFQPENIQGYATDY
jgi:hypothetical protein